MDRGVEHAIAIVGGALVGGGIIYVLDRYTNLFHNKASTITLPQPPGYGQPPSGPPSSGQRSSGQPSQRQPSSGQPSPSDCASALASGQLDLQEGDTGPCVVVVQNQLNQWGSQYGFDGFPNGQEIDVDGVYGPNTQQAVKAFQSRVGIRADGIVGPQTWAYLSQLTPPSQGTTPYSPSPGSSNSNPCGSGWWVETFDRFYDIYPIDFYSVTFSACMPNLPATLPDSFLPQYWLQQCTFYVGCGALTVVSGNSALAALAPQLPDQQVPALYGVAKYMGGQLVDTYAQTTPVGLGQVIPGAGCPQDVPNVTMPTYLALPWPG